MTTRADAIAAAAAAQASAIDRLAHRNPHEAAIAAYVPGGPTVEQLEARIRAWQNERRQPPTDTSRPSG